MEFRVYNTGDKIWVSKRYGRDTTVKLVTHDGMVWEEGDTTFHRLEGAEKYVHVIEVFLTKIILKVLST